MSNDASDGDGQDEDGAGGLEELEDLPYVGPSKAAALREAGFENVGDVRAASESDLAAVEGFGAALAGQVKDGLAEMGDAAAGPPEGDADERDGAETTMAEGGDASGRTEGIGDADEDRDTMGKDSTDDTDEPATPSAGEDEGRSIDTSLQVSDDGNVIEAEPIDEESVGERLLDNIEGLKSTLEDASKEGGRVEAQIRQLQTEVSDLKAYKHAIEEFLEENGTGQQVIDDVKGEMDDLDDDLRELREVARNHARVLTGLRDNYGTIAGRIEDQEDAIDAVRDTLDEHASDIEAVDADVEDVRATLGEHRTETDERLDAHAGDIETLQEATAANEEALESTAGDLADLSTQLDALRETTESRLGDQEERLDQVDAAIDEQDDAVTELRHDLDGATDDVAALETELDDAVSGLESAVDEQFAEAEAEREDVRAAVEENAGTIEALDDRIDDLQREVESLDERLGETQAVDERFADVEDDIEELRQWQEDLRNVMGGPGAGLGSEGGSE